MAGICDHCLNYKDLVKKIGKRCIHGSIHWHFCKYFDPKGLITVAETRAKITITHVLSNGVAPLKST